MQTIRALDIETSHEEEDQAEVIEIGSQDLVGEGHKWSIGPSRTDLIKPENPISAVTMGIHHITNEMVADAPARKDVIKLYAGADIYAAHNVRFEAKFLAIRSPCICTYKVALHLWPDAPNHKLGTLRYWRELQCDERAMPPHRALPDAYVCAVLLKHMLESEITVEQAVDVSSQPAILPKVLFGKHAGMKWQDVPRSYLEWVVNNITDNEDVSGTARHWLKHHQERRN
jgi:exodeoxyribonuclease X